MKENQRINIVQALQIMIDATGNDLEKIVLNQAIELINPATKQMNGIKDYEGSLSFISSIGDNPNFSDAMRNKADELAYYIKGGCKHLENMTMTKRVYEKLISFQLDDLKIGDKRIYDNREVIIIK